MSGYFAREEELRHHDRILRRFARRVTRSEADAEDAAQEAWLRSLQHPPLAERSIVRWLRVVVSRSALRTIGRERTRRLLLREVARTDSSPSVPCQLDERGSRERVERLIAQLDEPYRAVLRLRFLEDLSPGEIAIVLRRPEVTVRSQLKRGLDRLRTRMDGRRRLAGIAISFWRRLWPRATTRQAVAGLVVAGVVVLGASLMARDEQRVVSAAIEQVHSSRAVAVAPAASERKTVDLIASPPLAALDGAGSHDSAPAASVEGLVHRRGQSVAQAEIWASTMLAPPARSLDAARLVGHSDAEGRFRVALAGANTILWAEEIERGTDDRERGRTGSRRYALLDLELGARASVDLEMQELSRTRGVVLDPRGEPAPGARVSCAQAPGEPQVGAQGVLEFGPRPSWTTTDDEGRFELPVFVPGLLDAWVERDGRPAWSGEVSAAEELLIQLEEPGTVGGTVVGPDGAPLADCEVLLELPGGLPELTTRSDAEGRVHFGAVPPGAMTLSVLPALTGFSALRRVDCLSGRTHELGNLAVTSAASLVGRARRDGRPLEGWRVVTARPGSDGMLELIDTVTDADGSFEFKACRRKLHDLYLLDPTDDSGVPWATLSSVRPGADVLLEARPPSAVLYGDARRFTSGARLALRGSRLAAVIHVPLATNGEFEQRVPPGLYSPLLVLPGLGEVALPVIELAENEIRFVELAPPSTGGLEVRLALPGQWPLPDLAITVEGQGLRCQFVTGSPSKAGTLDLASRTLSLPQLLPGSYQLTARSPTLGLVGREFSVAAGETTWLDVALAPGTPVTVVVDADRPLHEGESLTVALCAPGLAMEQAVTAVAVGSGRAEDVYELQQSLANGDYALEVQSTCGLRGSLRFSVPGENQLALRLREPATR